MLALATPVGHDRSGCYLRDPIPQMSGFSGWDGQRERFARAFAQSQFLLYSQTVEKLSSGGDNRPRTEIYVRLEEEEQNVVPPGTFLARLEHYKFGPTLDQFRGPRPWSVLP